MSNGGRGPKSRRMQPLPVVGSTQICGDGVMPYLLGLPGPTESPFSTACYRIGWVEVRIVGKSNLHMK